MSDEKSFDSEEKSFEEKNCEMSRDSSSEIVDGVSPCPRLSGKDVADEIISSPQPKKMHKGTVQAEQVICFMSILVIRKKTLCLKRKYY